MEYIILDELKWTPLRMCVLEKDKQTATLLLKAGADPNIADIDNKTPLRLAYDDEMRKILSMNFKKKDEQQQEATKS